MVGGREGGRERGRGRVGGQSCNKWLRKMGRREEEGK